MPRGIQDSTEPDKHSSELLPEHKVHVLSILGRVREAASVAEPWTSLERECYRSGRRSGFGDGVVDVIPDQRIFMTSNILLSTSGHIAGATQRVISTDVDPAQAVITSVIDQPTGYLPC
ncbi:hypothetical protein HYQ46_002017 [Verticillium longisporum]|uniref:Uncharacterized protein n=1 Tax=Verticillium dahliae (strain VdLs.17 / ATCC MYA-4575 / FGSC 10137) TaxID=498257 RepID=G2X514_VERDV|nr:uncharacterized protein VDAG_05246 [Verticillium dahliae VdLs.17]EGY23808.1 hypothetical protein VDAG_05246 [Verticillium dahliae VdLs.17]KAG7149093.1 hypothetical protein HYQ46_002017 [Verticillium longisporum]KAH6699619.1 hypothetical protein EV126DRAFT_46227 [Verticillium dahliae]